MLFLPNTLGLHGNGYFGIELGEADIGLKHLLLRTKRQLGIIQNAILHDRTALGIFKWRLKSPRSRHLARC
jgi:hypothetical protein